MADTPLCPTTAKPMLRGVRPLVITYGGQRSVIDMPGWYCDESGESLHSREDMRISDRALSALKAESADLATPDEIRRIRTDLGLSVAEADRVIGGHSEIFARYENGEVLPSRAVTLLLRILSRHPEELTRLRTS